MTILLTFFCVTQVRRDLMSQLAMLLAILRKWVDSMMMMPVSRVSNTMFPVRKLKRKEDLSVSMIWLGSILSASRVLLLLLLLMMWLQISSCRVVNAEELWKAVLAVGDAARLVSEVVRRSGELSAYKAGLLHHSEYSHPPRPLPHQAGRWPLVISLAACRVSFVHCTGVS